LNAAISLLTHAKQPLPTTSLLSFSLRQLRVLRSRPLQYRSFTMAAPQETQGTLKIENVSHELFYTLLSTDEPLRRPTSVTPSLLPRRSTSKSGSKTTSSKPMLPLSKMFPSIQSLLQSSASSSPSSSPPWLTPTWYRKSSYGNLKKHTNHIHAERYSPRWSRFHSLQGRIRYWMGPYGGQESPVPPRIPLHRYAYQVMRRQAGS